MWLVADIADPIPRSRRLGAYGRVDGPAYTAGSAVVADNTGALDSTFGTLERRENCAKERDRLTIVWKQFRSGPDKDKSQIMASGAPPEYRGLS